MILIRFTLISFIITILYRIKMYKLCFALRIPHSPDPRRGYGGRDMPNKYKFLVIT